MGNLSDSERPIPPHIAWDRLSTARKCIAAIVEIGGSVALERLRTWRLSQDLRLPVEDVRAIKNEFRNELSAQEGK